MGHARHLAAGLAAASLVLAGCSAGDDDATTGSSEEFNDADVTFATEMIQHHAQALVMVDMTQGRSLDPEFAQLTEEIRAAQTPEIELMADWLADWDEPVPETSRDHANAHGGSGMHTGEMPGMMSQEELDGLEAAEGSAFESMWLTMMIEHHEGAVAMAEAEIEEGRFPEAVELAESIKSSQEAEIATMEQMLGG